MKAKVTILVIIGLILTSCGAETNTQEIEGITKTPVPQAPVAQEPIATEEFIAFVPTETPMEVSTEPSLACVTLLAPEKGIGLPATGKVTFSWTKMDVAANYVLNFILPSGQTTSFETDQTFRDRYMEAFVSGGEYQWQVTVQSEDGSDICNSEMFTFNKPAYEQSEKPKPQGSSSNEGSDNSESGNELPSGPPGTDDD